MSTTAGTSMRRTASFSFIGNSPHRLVLCNREVLRATVTQIVRRRSQWMYNVCNLLLPLDRNRMATLFRKILCPVDFDRVSLPALELVQKLALQNQATVYLLYVVPGQSLPGDLEKVARDNLRGIAQKWLADKIPHEIVV